MGLEERMERAEGLRIRVEGQYETIKPVKGPTLEELQAKSAHLARYRTLQRGGVGTMQDPEFARAQQDLVGKRLDLRDIGLTAVNPTEASRRRKVAALAEAHLQDALGPEDLKPFHLQAAYRIVRAILALSGRADENQLLNQALPSLEEWEIPSHRLDLVEKPDRWKLGPLALVVDYLQGFCPVPLMLDQFTPPEERSNLEGLVKVLTSCLGLDKGTADAPAAGRLGLTRLLENWPNPIELVAYEIDLLTAVYNGLTERGRKPTRNRILVVGLGFSPWEADALIVKADQMAVRYGRHRTTAADRELLVERLEGVGDRARSVSAFNHEINAIKEQAKATGINQRGDSLEDDLLSVHNDLEREEYEHDRKKRRLQAPKTMGGGRGAT